MSQYSTAVIITPDTLRTLNTNTLAGAYLPIGTPTTRAIREIIFTNSSNVVLTISWDGVNDHHILPVGATFALPITSLRSNVEGSQGIYVAIGTQFYIKGAAGVGLVYLSCIG